MIGMASAEPFKPDPRLLMVSMQSMPAQLRMAVDRAQASCAGADAAPEAAPLSSFTLDKPTVLVRPSSWGWATLVCTCQSWVPVM